MKFNPAGGEIGRPIPTCVGTPQGKQGFTNSGCGEIGRHTRLRIWRRKAWGFESLHPHTLPPKRELGRFQFDPTVLFQIVDNCVPDISDSIQLLLRRTLRLPDLYERFVNITR